MLQSVVATHCTCDREILASSNFFIMVYYIIVGAIDLVQSGVINEFHG